MHWPSRAAAAGGKTARRTIHEDRVVKAAVSPGSRFKGYQDFVVQDLVLRACAAAAARMLGGAGRAADHGCAAGGNIRPFRA